MNTVKRSGRFPANRPREQSRIINSEFGCGWATCLNQGPAEGNGLRPLAEDVENSPLSKLLKMAAVRSVDVFGFGVAVHPAKPSSKTIQEIRLIMLDGYLPTENHTRPAIRQKILLKNEDGGDYAPPPLHTNSPES